MRNIQISTLSQERFNGCVNGKFVLNENDSNKYFYTQDGIAVYSAEKDTIVLLYGLMETVGCEYLAITNELCAASRYGEVVSVNPVTGESTEVSFCEDGIEKMSWSPDQDIVVFVTKSKNVVVMTCTFDAISETSLETKDFGDKEFITIGWGKKETQFHGSEGKQAAKRTETVITQNIEELEQAINITWRGDSELFAVSYVGSRGRMFKVYNREGKLQCTSEAATGLGTAIAWRPSGSWIAVPQSLPNKYVIALFEKNGLRHREFTLPFNDSDERVVNLAWNADSDILAIETIKECTSCLYLFTMANYHWYLKQCLIFQTPIANWLWDFNIQEGKTLHVVTEDGTYTRYKWTLAVSCSVGRSKDDQAVVAVIDGRRLLITDFRNNIVPPPMSRSVFEMPTYLNSCGFLEWSTNGNDYNKLFTVSANNVISIFDLDYDYSSGKRKLTTLTLIQSAEITESISDGLGFTHWRYITDNSIIHCKQTGKSTIVRLGKVANNKLEVTSEVIVNGYVCDVIVVDDENLLVHSTDGFVYAVKITDLKNMNEPKVHSKLPEYCEHSAPIKAQDELRLVSLQSNGNLYVGGMKLESNVTSYFLTNKYLVYTLLTSIKFMNLFNNSIVGERRIERGGKLVTIVASDSRVVLQIPRGNLEVINPRVLSLDIIAELLDTFSYEKAMDILRKQRINLNIIVDHNPNEFLKHIDVFLDQIRNPNWLNLFLSDLTNEDFTKTMYSSNYHANANNYPEDYQIESKVQYICSKMSHRMEEKDFHFYLLPIITTYVKTGRIEKALEIIWNEKKQELESSTGDSTKEKVSEQTLKYLLYLVDVNNLYEEALGMYDFGLVLFVAGKSQKDPKEYVPYLNELRKLEENYQRFKIDEHLRRYERALEHIAKCGHDRIDEILEFIQKHSLHQKALSVFKDDDQCYKQIALCFADHLRSQGKHANASIMYERAGDLKQAVLSAKHILDWSTCLRLTKVLTKGDAEALKEISLSLLPALQDKGKFEAAWFVAKHYIKDFKLAMDNLLQGRNYLKAIFETEMEDPTLNETVIVPHLKGYAKELHTNVLLNRGLFEKYKHRLITVREERKKKQEEVCEDDIDECDLLSDTTSIRSSNYTSSSTGTGKTFRSSKNRRKHERKLLSLKEGNPYEDIALIDALYNLIASIKDEQTHIHDVCKALILIRCDDEARKIQQEFGSLLTVVKGSLDEIWIPEIMGNQPLNGSNFMQLQNDQRYAMINPQKRLKPQFDLMDWSHEILR